MKRGGCAGGGAKVAHASSLLWFNNRTGRLEACATVSDLSDCYPVAAFLLGLIEGIVR